MMAILCSDGQINLQELMKECVPGKWIPLLILKRQNKPPILPIFNLTEVAKTFIKRNLPKNWSHGAICLCEDDIEKIKSKGWEMEIFNFPRKVTDLQDMSLDFEIHEFSEVPDFLTSRM
jgi:hypothetical protein